MRLTTLLLCFTTVAAACGGKTETIDTPRGDGQTTGPSSSGGGNGSGSSSGGSDSSSTGSSSSGSSSSGSSSSGGSSGSSSGSADCYDHCPGCPASEPAQYSECSILGLSCDYAGAVCDCENPGTWFCNSNTGSSSSGSSSGGVAPACPPDPISPCYDPGLMCSYAAACGVAFCVCNSGGNWGCAYPDCPDASLAIDAGFAGD